MHSADDAGDDDERELLRRTLHELETSFDRVYESMRGSWNLPLGRRSIRTNVPSGSIFWIYIAFLLLSTATGIVLLVVGALQPLGIALLTGSLFAGGSFISQVWSLTVQNETKAFDLAYGDELNEWIQETARKIREIRTLLHEPESPQVDKPPIEETP